MNSGQRFVELGKVPFVLARMGSASMLSTAHR
jgi:hypothetical protein